ncbi:AlpA family phage regulatory protein [Neisseriaceae bacterium JH1-16]|nr:AlpA family phage regulatory protein [Neisseriaceae bacterium JH1-16]
MAAQLQSELVVIRRKQVEARTGLSRSAIYARIDPKSKYYDPTFPKPISLGTGAVGWLEHEVSSWISACIEASRRAA